MSEPSTSGLARLSESRANRRSWLERLQLALLTMLVVLPWTFPFTSGPSPTVWPWLASAVCGTLLAIGSPWTNARELRPIAGGAAAVVACAWFSHPAARVDVVYLFGGVVLILLSAAVANSPLPRRAMTIGLLVAAITSAALGLLQYFGFAAQLSPWVNYALPGEAYANLRQTNQYATLCWMGLGILLCNLCRIRWPPAVACAVLLAVGSAASVSRTGLLQAVMVGVLMVMWPAPDRRRRLTLCAIALFAYAAACLLLPIAYESVAGTLPTRTMWTRLETADGCHSRKLLWTNVLTLIAQRPWTGWGWGGLDAAHFLTLYQGPRFCEILDNAHNLPLHLAVELGLPIAVLVTAAALRWLWIARPWAEPDVKRQMAWALFGLIAIHSMLEYPLWYGPFQTTFGAVLGWLLARSQLGSTVKPTRLPTRVIGATLLVALLAVAFDYSRVSQIYLPPDKRWAFGGGDALAQARRSLVFGPQGRFAELTLTPVTRSNAEHIAALAWNVLRYSPEPRTVERLIEAETMLGHEREAVAMLARYRAAYSLEYERWRSVRFGERSGTAPPQD